MSDPDGTVLGAGEDVSIGNVLEEGELTEADHKVIEKVWATSYDELDEKTQRRAQKYLGNLPEPLRDIIEGNHYTEERIEDAMQEVFAGMQKEDFDEKMIDGAAVFAKGLRARLGYGEEVDDV